MKPCENEQEREGQSSQSQVTFIYIVLLTNCVKATAQYQNMNIFELFLTVPKAPLKPVNKKMADSKCFSWGCGGGSCRDLSKLTVSEMIIQPLLQLAEQEPFRIIGDITYFRWPIDL